MRDQVVGKGDAVKTVRRRDGCSRSQAVIAIRAPFGTAAVGDHTDVATLSWRIAPEINPRVAQPPLRFAEEIAPQPVRKPEHENGRERENEQFSRQ
jgi:hypothetical protein